MCPRPWIYPRILAALWVAAATAEAAEPSPATRERVEADWLQQEVVVRGLQPDSPQAVQGVLGRGRALADDLEKAGAAAAARKARAELQSIADECGRMAGQPAGDAWLALYRRARWSVRTLALASPALDFSELLFVKRVWPKYNHQCSHRVGEAQVPPANLCVLSGLDGTGATRPLLTGEMAAGGIGRPDLSCDAQRVVFPYAAPRQPATAYGIGIHGARSGSCQAYDIYEVKIDGSELRQLTATPNIEDTEPCYLPGGRIAFTSSRDGRYVQCGDWALVCGIFSMNADGSDVRKITEAQEGEFYPSVLDDGRILYTRWDYVMKGYNVIQQLWSVSPDGTKAQLAYGDWYEFSRGPIALFEARQIPGTRKVIATGAAHHNTGVGPVMIANLELNRLGPAGMANITPWVGYPECNAIPLDERKDPSAKCLPVISNASGPTGWYSSPYPLTEKLFLACGSYDSSTIDPDAFAIYLMDVHGNQELVHREEGSSCYSPIPLKARRAPPAIADTVRNVQPNTPGKVAMYDVYQGLDGVKRGTVRYLRVLQAHAKIEHTWPQRMDFGLNSGWDQRTVLGTVPVEADGSAYFEVPPNTMLFYQALDARHREIRRMRNYMNVMPGESASCIGCHESPASAPPAAGETLAMRRPASKIEPPAWGSNAMSYPRLVQPVFDRHCIGCHDGGTAKGKAFDLRGETMVVAPAGNDRDEGPQHFVSRSFLNLLPYVRYIKVGGYHGEKLPLKPGATGSGASPLLALLDSGHYGVKLEEIDSQMLAAWIDCNAPYYGEWSELVTSGSVILGSADNSGAEAQRRKALQESLGRNERLALYLDCGLEDRTGDGKGLSLQQNTGAWYAFPGAPEDIIATQRHISFDGQALKFTLRGLSERERYTFGLSWWDYDAGGRVQGLTARNGKKRVELTLLDPTRLPSYSDRKQPPECRTLELPAELLAGGGDVELFIRRHQGVNAVVCEVWLTASPR